MLFCGDEAINEMRQDAIRTSDALLVMRDERHHRLHLRYRCGREVDLQTSGGFLGQTREFKPDALGINAATKQIYRNVCTKYLNAPPSAAVKPEFDQPLFDHMCKITEAASVDSASNEVVAVKDMSWHPSQDGFCPNCKFILRDACHSGRRVLGRLFKADPVLDNILGLFVHWRDSMGQLIHHSADLQSLYAECTAASHDGAVETKFRNLRSAKHRVETYFRPLGRCILDLTALIAFAMKLTILRKGEREGKAAVAFLTALSVQLMVLAAMMADAGNETMFLLRTLDTENLELSELNKILEDFMDRITFLFFKNGVFAIGAL